MKTTTLIVAGKTLDIEYEHDEGEPGGEDGPGQPPRADIHSIKHEGLELIDMLDESWLKHFEGRVYYEDCINV